MTLACTLALSACGGGGSSDSDPSAENATGVFTDAPVAGLNYSASPSGLSGVTNAAGEFDYRSGDTVVFSVAGLELGSVEGAATVSPADVAGDADVASNLMVLLQSLDNDSDPNTITLPTNLGTDALAEVDLTLAPIDFADPAKNTVLAAAAPTGELVSPEAAAKHASDYFWTQADGVWMLQPDDEAESAAFVRIRGHQDHDFDPSTPTRHAFMLGDIGVAGPEDEGGGPGPESGYLAWNPLTNALEVSQILTDGNGDWGLSPVVPRTFKLEGDKLRLVETYAADDVFKATLKRVANDPNGLTGAWLVLQQDGSERFNRQTVVFMPDNRYVMIDPVGDEEQVGCGSIGIEDGSFTAVNGVLKVTAIQQDTNGCAGLNDAEDETVGMATLDYEISADGNTLTLSEGGEVAATLKRVSK